MAMTVFNFTGSDWTDPDPKDGRYWECLQECLKERVSHVTSSYGPTVNAWNPQSENSGIIYSSGFMLSFDTVLWDTIPKYYEVTFTYNTAGGVVYDSETGIISCPISGAYVTYTLDTEYIIALFTATSAVYTVDKIMDLAGLASGDGKLIYGNAPTDSATVKQWLISRYKMLKLMTCYGALNKTIYAGVTRSSRLNRLRRATGILGDWYPETDPMPAPTYSAATWRMTARSYDNTNYTGTSSAILDALEDVEESTTDDGSLKVACSFGGSAPSTYQNLSYILTNCSGPHSFLPGIDMDTVYSSHYNSDMVIRILDGTAPIADVPLSVYASDDIGFDGAGQFYADQQSKESTTSGTEFTLEFGLDDIPPIPDANDMTYGTCSTSPFGSTRTDRRYLKCGYDSPWDPTVKVDEADVDISTPENKITKLWII